MPLAPKPDKLPRWADLDVGNGPSGQNNVSEPSETKKNQGWDYSEYPPREFQNWLHRKTYQYLLYLEQKNNHASDYFTNQW